MKERLINRLENYLINDYTKTDEDVYNDLYNIIQDYEEESGDYSLDFYFDEIVSYEIAEDMAKYQLESGGLIRLYYFLGNANIQSYDLFKVNGYGNLEELTRQDLAEIVSDIIEGLKND